MASKYAITVTKPVFELIPAGTYHVRLRDIEDGPTFVSKAGEPEPTIKLQLEVAKGPHAGMRLSQLINPASWGPKSNSRRWAEALTGGELEEGAVFDPTDHIGDVVWARVLVEPDSKGIERNKVDVVLSLAAIEAQVSGVGTAAPRPVFRPTAPAPEPDRALDLPDEAWDAMEPPPAEDGEEAR